MKFQRDRSAKNAWCKLQRVPAELSLASPQYPPEKPEKLRRQSENLLDLLIRGPPQKKTYPMVNVYIANWKITIFKRKSTISMCHVQ